MLFSLLTPHIICLLHLLFLPLFDLLLPVPPRPLLLFSSFHLLLIYLRDTLFLKFPRCFLSYHNPSLLPSPFPSTVAFTDCHRNSRGFLRIYSLHGGHPPWQLASRLQIESARSARYRYSIIIPIVCGALE